MLNICFLFTIAAIYLSTGDAKETGFIVGGKNAAEGEFPYQISLQYNYEHNCGGSIITSCWILTAAHCVKDFPQSELDVLAGTTKLNCGGVRAAIEKIIIHENYTEPTVNDIALIKLKKCLPLNNSTIKPVQLTGNYIEAGFSGIVSGFGFTNQNGTRKTNDLKKLTVKTISNEDCKTRLQRSIPDEDLCTLNKVGQGFCQADSGGPLVDATSKGLIGVVSGNVPCARGYPDIYLRVASYLQWILNNAK